MNIQSIARVLSALLFILTTMPSFAKEYPGESIFHLKGEWINPEGKIAQLSELEGRVSALALVYTSCQYSCPLIIEEFNQIKKKLSSESMAKVNFVLVSMDPERDTPEALKKFASKRNLDLAIWRIFTSKSEKSVRELAAALGANIKKVGKEFAHSNLITVINSEGVIEFAKPNIGQQIDETASAIDKSIQKITKK